MKDLIGFLRPIAEFSAVMRPKINQLIVLLLLISMVTISCASAKSRRANGCGCPPHKWNERQ
ncbi:MAG: hypothetical protein B7Y15_06305 [Bacteroidetes bacterium 24-39-8]|nr:MAG: hypothetical protein B7Y69_00630 [Sphingobacteriia bacterium 35-40-8]OYZ51316.1 MAG: hypothetical protein B7Y15_06305 [Bacteroidetes bacterium 24-39-8]OZA65728.1 MAG: hypothetical protein B7X72_07070 [Sphingobacteriia bacterium 39-39-8]